MKLFEKLQLKWNRKAKEIVEKGLLPQTDEEFLYLLQRIDAGDHPTEEQTRALKELTVMDLSGTKITVLPESIQHLSNLQALKLSFSQISALPKSFGQLANLQKLDLCFTQITVLPDFVGQLSKLQRLDLSGTKITAVPESLGQISDLRQLYLSGTQITALPESVWQIANLQTLGISGTQITALPKLIGQLTNLQELYLGGTQITALPEKVWQLTKLQELDLRYSEITSLPEHIGQLANLRALNLCGTQITALPESLGQLVNLQELYLRGTQITALPESLGQLAELQTLDLDSTPITALPESLGQLANLQKLYLDNTPITSLPDWLGSLPALRHLDLNGLTLPSIPEALALRGLPFVEEEHFASDKPGVNLWGVTLTEQKKSVFLETPGLIPELYRKEELVPVRACKVIFLGDGGVGKSYTIRRFRAGGKKESEENRYPTEETHGVEIGDCPAEYGGTGFDIRFWDFGGQEILHSMHRCFLTEESCYVVMVRTRETESTPRARYWLRAVQTAAPNSPALLFVNCWGNARGDRAIDATRLEREFPQIRKIVYCSAQQAEEGEFRREFMDPLLEMAAASDMCGKTINRRWDRLIRSIQDLQRNAIEKREQNYLDRETYLRLCGEAEIGADKTGDLLTLLNNLGVCFSYHRDPESSRELPDYKLLNPVWLTNALYAIVEEGAAPAQAGIITVDAIRAMLHNAAQAWFPKKSYRRTAPELVYADEECQYILDVAQAHRLCYRVDAERVFFPALCGTDSPPEALTGVEGSRQVSYLLRYSYLPDSVLHQLMIRCMQSGMVVEPRWLKGMVLSVWKLHTAHVRIAEDSLRIDVYSKGEQRAYELFWTLRREIEEINRRLRLSAKEFILDEGKPDAAKEFPLGAVLGAARENTPLFDENGNKHDARALLGQFYEESFVQTMRVENGAIVIPIAARTYHPCAKGNPALRKALYEAYNEICPYCGRAIPSLRDMQVDHILPTEYRERPELQSYLDYLSSCGFNIEKPDYIENYFPTHGYCNRDKSNRVNEFTLPYWHDIAAQHAPRVLRLMEKLQGKEHLADD